MKQVGRDYDNVDSQHTFVTKSFCRIKEGRAKSKHKRYQKMSEVCSTSQNKKNTEKTNVTHIR